MWRRVPRQARSGIAPNRVPCLILNTGKLDLAPCGAVSASAEYAALTLDVETVHPRGYGALARSSILVVELNQV